MFRFYLITDRLHTKADPVEWVGALSRTGLKAMQVREKDLSPYDLGAYVHRLQEEMGAGTGPEGTGLYLNDRADLALALELVGVHLREESLSLEEQAPVLRSALTWGVSTHSLAGVQAAQAAGADFVTFGPVFATPSKAEYGEPLGLEALAQAAESTSLPLLALGGVTLERVRPCLDAGAYGVAVIGALWNAADPLAALKAFEEALGGL